MAKHNYASRMHILVQYFLLPLQTLLSQMGSPGFTQSAFVTHATQMLFGMSQTGSAGSVQSVFELHATISTFR